MTTEPESEPSCCTPANAWIWVRELAVLALAGDLDAQRALPEAVEHYLRAVWQPMRTPY